MPWTLNDYPSSMKNLNDVTKKKAIDIANSMVDEGYEEGRAIPIAIEQAKEWRKNASKSEVETYEKSGKPIERSEEGKKYENNPERLEEGEQVVKHEEGWAVKSSNAKQPSNVFNNKNDAVKRAREIAKNKGTSLTIYKADGTVEEKQSYNEK
ncbi:hypothetical protein CIL05_05605 [Virgibacillus profundi]|uniref:DUF2188 domain-containing protein n=1 Tax=Virgibacillus profundi TaxID=2024555 RepID=A0A2A2IFZ2_9BACI|nr:DUF2188 domain-containing protein [Virgibacillus profundi]PAV30577.1 hypothetical protein CIL05_05605 [Virgibacillus profundi]PXY54749.1 DUF2188 domain-containing protein [Virgibacillus profundi]